ncbi:MULTISPECIES: acyl carrier protein [unclassified Streptomyces]|uniref:acyl carrier protein n=1 Tax=unclassified Streptomyces TaxID=2593676 RepID=UPI002E79FE9A|nr:acyl carrier protein [Streptomyces sp. JV176]MEE1802232.1 acyl carrier protein [Streptomyces sp. JV176]
MEQSEIANAVREVVREIAPNISEMKESVSLNSLGLDSLGSVELTLRLEDHFGVVFEDDELAFENFESVASIVDLLSAKTAA